MQAQLGRMANIVSRRARVEVSGGVAIACWSAWSNVAGKANKYMSNAPPADQEVGVQRTVRVADELVPVQPFRRGEPPLLPSSAVNGDVAPRRKEARRPRKVQRARWPRAGERREEVVHQRALAGAHAAAEVQPARARGGRRREEGRWC